jgi:GT2 family glycosyltransferase
VTAVVVPTHDRAEDLARLLESLRAQTLAHQVVVVDNGSGDGTAELLRVRFPEVRLIAIPENVGFGRAVNEGVRACHAATVVVVNNDVVCEPEFLERLLAVLDPAGGVTMAAGVLLDATDPDRIDSAGVLVDRTLFALDHLHDRHVSVLEGGPPDPLGPTGGAAAFDREAFLSVDGFDERFFAYLEDVDLAVRLLAAGGRCRLAAGARATHRHSATLGSGSRRKNELMGWGRGYMIGKYRLHRRPALLVRAAAAEAVVVCGQAVVDRTLVGLPARVRGFRAGLGAPAADVPRLPPETMRISLLAALRHRARRRRPSRLGQFLFPRLAALGLVAGAVTATVWPIWAAGAAFALLAVALALISTLGLGVLVLAAAVAAAVWPGLALALAALAGIVMLARRAPAFGFVAALGFFAAEGTVKLLLTLGGSPLPVGPLALGALLVDLGLVAGVGGLLLSRRADLRGLWNRLDRLGRTGVLLIGAWFAASVVQIAQSGDLAKSLLGFRLTQGYTLAALGGLLVFLAARRDERIVRFLLAAFAVVAGYAAVRVAVGPAEPERLFAAGRPGVTYYGEIFRAVGSFSGAVGLASYLVPTGAFAFVLALLEPRFRWIGLAVFGAAVIGIVGTYARAALIAVAMGVVLAAAVAAASPSLPRRSKAAALLAVAATLAAGGAAVALAGRDSPQLEERTRAFVDPGEDESLRLRLDTWRDSLADVVDRPFGSGLGTVGRASSLGGDPLVTTDNAYLKIAREQGIVVTAAFVVGLALAGIAAARRLRRATALRRALGAAALVGSACFLVLAGAGEYVEQPGKVVFWTLLGLALAAAYAPEEPA